ncbi:hypothetical protein CEXT_476951 [Caerostris extrusa]|uniref:Uncharacterized protein n=1 Tax=Caerostris extrusa TaxID=172846 RepID=A0AAV4PAF7_CAEEX|nr:hypothetical protein CEXT_476951 [Caerostris extrusa]
MIIDKDNLPRHPAEYKNSAAGLESRNAFPATTSIMESSNCSINQRCLKHGKPYFFRECSIVGLIENTTCINCGKQENLTKPSS